MNKILTLALLTATCICLSCRKRNPQTQPEQTAVNFCETFYNLNYPAAKEWSTPSFLPYLSFLASNISQAHLDQLKGQETATASVIASSEITPRSETATIICQINNALTVNPIDGEIKRISFLQDTLRLLKENDKWLVRKDIPQQNERRNHD